MGYVDNEESDRAADRYELRLHRASAVRGFLLGGALLTSAWSHRGRANALEEGLRLPRRVR